MKVTYHLPTAIVSYTRLCLKIICELKRQQARLYTLLAKFKRLLNELSIIFSRTRIWLRSQIVTSSPIWITRGFVIWQRSGGRPLKTLAFFVQHAGSFQERLFNFQYLFQQVKTLPENRRNISIIMIINKTKLLFYRVPIYFKFRVPSYFKALMLFTFPYYIFIYHLTMSLSSLVSLIDFHLSILFFYPAPRS